MNTCEICRGSTWLLDDAGEAVACECRRVFESSEFRDARRRSALLAARPELAEPAPAPEGSHSAPEILRELFGHAEFRESQGDVVAHVAAGHDALVVMPTGGGKSICFQVPAISRQRRGLGITIVVAPLLSLMRDQVEALRRPGLSAELLDSSAEGRRARARMLRGATSVVYVTPERATSREFLEDVAALAAARRLALIAVDEAHCVAHWGRDFRPDYLALGELRDAAPDVPCVALTASADELTRTEILRSLKMGEATVFLTDLDRPNIRYLVDERRDPDEQLLEFLHRRHWNQCGIVYCRRRDAVERVVAFLRAHGVRALAFHAGLTGREKRRAQSAFAHDDAVVLVGTVAFGMGIDRSDVRFVAHLDLPVSIEAYHQETGRAGRDGGPAEAWLLYSDAQAAQTRATIAAGEDTRTTHQALRRFDALVEVLTATSCRRQRLLAHFGQEISPCGNCDACAEQPRVTGVASAPQTSTTYSVEGQSLEAELRTLRGSISRELGVPALAVYTDRAITAIARQQPRDLDELAGVKGFSTARIEAYGDRVLDVLHGAS